MATDTTTEQTEIADALKVLGKFVRSGRARSALAVLEGEVSTTSTTSDEEPGKPRFPTAEEIAKHLLGDTTSARSDATAGDGQGQGNSAEGGHDE